MENESKKKIKNKVILYTVGGVLTANLIKDIVLGIKDSSIRGKSDASHENSVGYENINTRFNTKVHVNNFVVLHIKRKERAFCEEIIKLSIFRKKGQILLTFSMWKTI